LEIKEKKRKEKGRKSNSSTLKNGLKDITTLFSLLSKLHIILVRLIIEDECRGLVFKINAKYSGEKKKKKNKIKI